jgi:uncharacterized protein
MKSFLTAEWRKLAVANYVVDPSLLRKYIPAGTSLDIRDGKCFVSLVGFMFLDTRAMGLRIPFHINFEEVNLRFYLTHTDVSGEQKRGVAFIREVVPKPALSYIANWLYGERYITLPMTHAWIENESRKVIQYRWRSSQWNEISVTASANASDIQPGSEEEFILEHYWGYTKISDRKTFEYKVEHPRWQVYQVESFNIDVDFKSLYGMEFNFLRFEQPESVFLAEGSPISVSSKRTIPLHAAVSEPVRW